MSDSDRGDGNKAVNQAFNLIVAFALVGIIVGVLAYSAGQERERRYQQPAAYAESAKEAAQRTCVGSNPSAVFECVYEKVKASQEQAQAEQDLTAQQQMALWATLMGIFTFGTLGVTGLGVWYVKRTLETNVGFLKESSEATRAMVTANKQARDQVRAQPVTYDHAIAFWRLDGCEANYGQMVFHYENRGATVAKLLKYKITAHCVYDGQVQKLARKKFTKARIEPDGRFYFAEQLVVDQSEFSAKILQNPAKILVTIRQTFYDIFGEKQSVCIHLQGRITRQNVNGATRLACNKFRHPEAKLLSRVFPNLRKG